MDNMDYGSHYDVVDQNGSHMVPEPTVKDFIICYLAADSLCSQLFHLRNLLSDSLDRVGLQRQQPGEEQFRQGAASCDADFPCAGVLRLYLFRRCPDRYKRSFLNSDQSGRARLGAFCRI